MKYLLSVILFLSLSSSVFASGSCTGPWIDTAFMKVKVYQFAVSTSTACTNPVVIFSSAGGREMDLLKNPTLGGGNIPDGVYTCLMITMSDQIKISPTTSDGLQCVAGTQYIKDTCRADDGTANSDLLIGTTFNNVACHGTIVGAVSTPVEDMVTLYLTTVGGGAGSAWNKPTSTTSTNPVLLNAPFVVSGSSVGTFVVNARNGLCTSGVCSPEAMTFGFR